MMAKTNYTLEQWWVIVAAESYVENRYPIVARQIRAHNKQRAQTCAVCSCCYEIHTHMRMGTDCGLCGRARCPGFVRSTYLSRAWRRWQNRKAVGA